MDATTHTVASTYTLVHSPLDVTRRDPLGVRFFLVMDDGWLDGENGKWELIGKPLYHNGLHRA
jgi:hypothetical protein